MFNEGAGVCDGVRCMAGTRARGDVGVQMVWQRLLRLCREGAAAMETYKLNGVKWRVLQGVLLANLPKQRQV